MKLAAAAILLIVAQGCSPEQPEIINNGIEMSSQAAASLIAAALATDRQPQAQPAFRYPDIAAPALTAEEKQELAHRATRFIGIALKVKTHKQAVRLWDWADHQPEGPGAYDEIITGMHPQWRKL